MPLLLLLLLPSSSTLPRPLPLPLPPVGNMSLPVCTCHFLSPHPLGLWRLLLQLAPWALSWLRGTLLCYSFPMFLLFSGQLRIGFEPCVPVLLGRSFLNFLPFSCSTPALWLLLATIRAYLAHGAGAFPSPALPLPCGFLLATIRAYLAHWAVAFPSHAFLPDCCGFCLPPFASIWPTGLAPFLLMLFSRLVVAFACYHSRLFGPLGCRLFSCFSPCLSWLLLATTCA